MSMHQIVALQENYGFHKRHFERGAKISASSEELAALASQRGLPADIMFPPPHFRFVDEKLNEKAVAFIRQRLTAKRGLKGPQAAEIGTDAPRKSRGTQKAESPKE